MNVTTHYFEGRISNEPALNVVGTQVTVLASNATTRSYGITLQQGEEGTALHRIATIGTKRSTS